MPSSAFITDLKFPACEPDFSTTMMQVYEYATSMVPNCPQPLPTLTYRRRTTPDINKIDDLHAEVLPANREWTDYSFPVWVQAQPKRQELSKFGIDEPRELEIRIALPVLEENGLVVQQNAQEFSGGAFVDVDPATKDGGALLFLVSMGDRIVFQGSQYEVLSMHQDQFWANTEIPMWLVGFCNKTRANTTTDITLDDSDEAWRTDDYNPINDLP